VEAPPVLDLLHRLFGNHVPAGPQSLGSRPFHERVHAVRGTWCVGPACPGAPAVPN